MLFDAEQRREDWFAGITFDVCVCGAGPAGITLARELAAKGWRVALCESGGLELKPEAQDLNIGRIAGLDYYPLEAARLRALGGTSGHWDGFMWPLDARDFEPLPHHKLSGWPIKKSDLDPFAAEAASILDLAPSEQYPDIFQGAPGPLVPTAPRRSQPPTRFGEKFRGELESGQVHVYFNATLVDLELDADLRSVSTLVFRSYRRQDKFTIRARYIALCLGGIENARFLLNANRQLKGGIGNQNDLVGRFFCEHPHLRLGSPAFRSGTSLPRADIVSYYKLSEAEILKQKCLSFGLYLFAGPEPSDEITARNLARDAVCMTPFSRWVVSKLLGRPLACARTATLYGAFEQALNPDSRVLLSDELDRFGQRRAVLDWRLTELDYHTMRVAAMEFGRRLAESDIGRLQIEEWLRAPNPTLPGIDKDFVAGFHHMCTTRMSDDPRSGVVDGSCKVHGLENLYLGGSSVFATPISHKTPTFPIVCLALRLAAHLDARLRQP